MSDNILFFISVAATALLAILSGMATVSGTTWSKDRKRILVIAIAVLVIMYGGSTYMDRKQTTAEADASSKRYTSKVEELHALTTRLGSVQTRINELEELNLEQGKQNLQQSTINFQLSARIKDELLAKNSFALLRFMPDENGNGIPFLIHFGENTIRGLSVRVHDADKANLSSTSPLSTLDQDFTIEFPFLGKGQSVWNRQAVVPLGGDNRNFNIFFNSANSGWIQEKHMRRVDGKWIGANRVRLDHPSRKILYQCVDSDFPIRSLGDSDSWRTMIGCVEKSR